MSVDSKTFMEAEVWPRLSHELVFKNLSGLKRTRTGIEADCPKCGGKGTFYATDGQRMGYCNRKNNCDHKTGWWPHVADTYGLGNKQAVFLYLCDLAGATPPGQSNSGNQVKISDQYEARELITRYGRQQLFGGDTEAVKIRAYLLDERGFTLEELKGTEIMYIERKGALKYLYSKGVQEKFINNSGMLTGKFGEDYRLMFPFRNEEGKIDGFIARLNPDLSPIDGIRPKYKNSFGLNKSIPFLFNEANKEEIKTIKVIESPLDALLMKAKKLKGYVAFGGDNPSLEAEAKLAKCHADFILTALDDDTAGKRATIRLIPRLMAAGKRVFVVHGYQGLKAPGDMLLAKGVEALTNHLNECAVSASYWALLQALPRMKEMSDYGKAVELATLSPIYKGESEEEQEEFLRAAEEVTLLHPDDIRVAVGG